MTSDRPDETRTSPDQERPIAFTVTLTEAQRQTVLSALASELVDAKRYLFGPKPSPTPGPIDDCCDAHRARWQRDLENHRALKARHKHIKKTVKQFLYDGEVF